MKKIFLVLVVMLLIFSCNKNRVNTVPPVITLSGQSTVYIRVQTPWTELGYKAVDYYGVDISSKVVVDLSNLNTNIEGSYTITYNVIDDYGNSASPITRYVLVGDEFAPEIKLIGTNPLITTIGIEYKEEGATALSNDGVDLTENIVIDSSSLDISKIGTYNVIYSVFDNTGAQAVVIRYVSVVHSDNPSLSFKDVKVTEDTPVSVDEGLQLPDFNQNNPSIVLKYEQYLLSKLPNLESFDLKDGDISYKIKLENNLNGSEEEVGNYKNLLSSLKAGSTDIFKIYFSVEDSDGNIAKLPCYVQIVSDATPPIIKFLTEEEANMDTLEVNVWVTNTAEYTGKVDSLAIRVSDNNDTNGNFVTVAESKTYGMKVEKDDSSLMTALTYINDSEAPSRYHRALYDASKNIYTVTWTVTDKAGNSSTLSKKYQLIDTTAPVMLIDASNTYSISYASPKEIFPQYKDNSGEKGYSSPKDNGGFELVDTRKVGSYPVILSAKDAVGNETAKSVTYSILQPTISNLSSRNLGFENTPDNFVWTLSGLTFRWKSTFTWDTKGITHINYIDGDATIFSINNSEKHGGNSSLFFTGTAKSATSTWIVRVYGSILNTVSQYFYKDVNYNIKYYYKVNESPQGNKDYNPKNGLYIRNTVTNAEVVSNEIQTTKDSNWHEVSVDFTPTEDINGIIIEFKTFYDLAVSANGDSNSLFIDDFSLAVKSFPTK